LVKSRLR